MQIGGIFLEMNQYVCNYQGFHNENKKGMNKFFEQLTDPQLSGSRYRLLSIY